jgi:putative transcriptional regulator
MKKTQLGQEIIASLNEGLEFAQGKKNLRTTTASLPDNPPKITKKVLKEIRKSLNVSQPVLARYLGVSTSVVRAWEQGQSNPSGAASRLLQIARVSPKTFIFIVVNAGLSDRSDRLKKIEEAILEEVA